ncbi:RND transporter [Corallococcus sp. H22C18031201]|nr:RND transporter [Corallococcus sp. H22C18031201]
MRGAFSSWRSGGTVAVCQRWGLVLLAGCLGLGCPVGPNYRRPSVVVPAHFKEASNGWMPARPNDESERGPWWEVFQEPELNALEARVASANQTVAGFEAAYWQARALVAQARAAWFPQLGASASATRARGASGTGGTGSTPTTPTQVPSTGSSGAGNIYRLSVDASWELDLWGRVRRQLASAKASAQGAAANLANAKLSAQAMLAQSYFQVRALDASQRLLDDTVVANEKLLTLTQNRYAQGVVSRADVLQAQTQVQLARAAAVENEIARAQLEHAIAVLVGEPASGFVLPRTPLRAVPPPLPLRLPSSLLERRPDVAAAERKAAAANEQIGVAIAAFFPDLSLSASTGFTSAALSQWLSAPAWVWSLGPQLVATLFDGGQRLAQTDAARAAYAQSVAEYRQTVLSAFQDVEDALVSLRVLEEELVFQQAAVESAKQALEISVNQYKAGTATYLEVLIAQTTAFAAEEKWVNLSGQRMVSAVGLIKALGGGWDAKELDPKEK